MVSCFEGHNDDLMGRAARWCYSASGESMHACWVQPLLLCNRTESTLLAILRLIVICWLFSKGTHIGAAPDGQVWVNVIR